MGEYDFKSKDKKTVTFNLYNTQAQYLETMENMSHYVRWVFDNDEGYQKYMDNERKIKR